jgi:GDP-L-fucose synthase
VTKKKVLIFGGNGLVGSACKRIFSKDKSYTTIVSTRSDTNLFNIDETKKTIEKIKPDVIINAAAKVGGIVANNSLRSEFILENLKININIFESCINFPEIMIINLGSSCIYPLNAPNPIKESSFMEGKLEKTNSPYAMAKLTAIEIGRSLNIQFGHNVKNLMPTNLYGPFDNFSENESHVIPGLITRMKKAKDSNQSIFKVWGDGSPKREFLYVDDLASAIKFVIENNISQDLINVGSGIEISIKELAYEIRDLIKFKGKIEFDKNMPNGNPRKLLDNSLLKNYGWFPEVQLKAGLQKTYDWFLNSLS